MRTICEVFSDEEMHPKRKVSLFRNGRNQVICSPREFELEGDKLIIEPLHKPGLLTILSGMETLDEQLPDIDTHFEALDDIEL